jgi:hypothetical protein
MAPHGVPHSIFYVFQAFSLREYRVTEGPSGVAAFRGFLNQENYFLLH